MCKVMMIAGIKPEKVPLVAKLAKHMAKAMSNMEEDGVGYAAITNDCQVYGEKWLNKDDAFNVHSAPPPNAIVMKIAETFGDHTIEWDKKPVIGNAYSAFGQRTTATIQNTVAMILHARKATQGSKTIENVHPFVETKTQDGEPAATALIHNGSIFNHDKLTKKRSECDSEVILHEYLGNMMYHNPWGVEQLAKTLVGTYTVGVLSSMLVDDKWTPYLDILKSNKELMGGYVPELETMVFSTNKYTLEEALKASEMTLENDFKFKDGYLHRLNAVTGEMLETPISFVTSAQHMSGYNKQHENSAVGTRPGNARGSHDFSKVFPFGPIRNGNDANLTELELSKRQFERRHPSLFTTPYLEGNISSDEQEVFDLLAKEQTTDHKALRLVSAALGMSAAGA